MKLSKAVFSLLLCLSLLAACGGGGAAPGEDSGGTEAPAAPSDPGALAPGPDEEPVTTMFRVVDGAACGDLLLAKLCRCIGPDVCRLSVGDIPVTLDGEAADASVLEDGMPIEVSYSGDVLETYPAQLGGVYEIAAWSLGTEKNPGGSCYDLCGLYLQVLDDLWEKDSGLNENIAIAGLDLSRAPGDLAESEKSAIAWRFGETHGVVTVMGTFEELKDQGYFTAAAISTPAPEEGEDYSHMWVAWEDGCLFTIEASEGHAGEIYSLPTLFFSAEKWRTPLGAYYFHDCTAVWPEVGTWKDYQIGAELIS